MKTTNKLVLLAIIIFYTVQSNASDSQMNIVTSYTDILLSDKKEVDAIEENQYEYADRIISTSKRKLKNNDLYGAVDYFTQNIKECKYTDGDVMYQIAFYAEQLRNLVNIYSMQQANTYNGYNAGNLLAEAYNNSNRVTQLNSIMVAFCMVAAQQGSTSANEMLQRLQREAGQVAPSVPSVESNNAYRKQQLLDNIAKYEKAIQDVQRQMGNGIATDMMGNQIISDYRRMSEQAKQELRNMGDSIY